MRLRQSRRRRKRKSSYSIANRQRSRRWRPEWKDATEPKAVLNDRKCHSRCCRTGSLQKKQKRHCRSSARKIPILRSYAGRAPTPTQGGSSTELGERKFQGTVGLARRQPTLRLSR